MKSENEDSMNEQKSKKLPLIIVVIALFVVAFVLIFAVFNNGPEAIFEKQIDKLLSSEENIDYDTIKMNMDLEMSIDGADEVKEIGNLLNDAKIHLDVEQDNVTNEQLVGLNLTKAGQELLEANIKIDEENEKAYINLGQLFDKTIEMDASELLDEVGENSTETLNFMQLVNLKKAQSILRKEIKQELKSEYFSSEKTTIDDENVTKNILKMTGSEFKNTIKNICTNLMEDDNFINCFEEEQEVKADLQEIIDEVEAAEIPDDIDIEIAIYTTGLFPKIQRVDFAITEDGQTVTLQLTEMAEKEYTYKILSQDEEVLTGTLKMEGTDEDATVEMTAQIEEITITAKASAKVIYDEALSEFDISNVVSSEELTMEDIWLLYSNFMESELYEIIENVYGNGIAE